MLVQFLLFVLCQGQVQVGRLQFTTLFAHDKQTKFIQFSSSFIETPQIAISLVGIHINGDIPKNLGFEPQIGQISGNGFQFSVINTNSKIDHLEYLWIAIIDDRMHLRCHTMIQQKEVIQFEREFWELPQLQILIIGFNKESQSSDLKFSLQMENLKTNQFDISLQRQSQHTFKSVSFCYIAGPSNLIRIKQISNINQKTDEYVELEESERLIFGLGKISNFYGVLMVQLGQFEYEDSKPGVGISQIDINIVQIKIEEPIQCPIGYYECNYKGTFIDLCEKGESEAWKHLKSIKTIKNWNKQFLLQNMKVLKTNIDSPCINDISSYLSDSQLKNYNLDFRKANQQLKKDISVRLFQNSSSKQLRFNNKENQPSNSSHPQAATKLLQALQRPLLRVLRDLVTLRMSVVCEKSIFDDVFSVGVSENSETHLDHFNNQISQIESLIKLSQCDAYKISFANLRCENKKRSKTNFSTIGSLKMSTVQESSIKYQYTVQNFNQLFIVIQNIRRKREMIALQELRFFVMQQDLSIINQRLEGVKLDCLKKVINNKVKADRLVQNVCLNYWLHQAINIKMLEYFVQKTQHCFNVRIKSDIKKLKHNACKLQAFKRLQQLIKANKKKTFQVIHQYSDSLILGDVLLRQFKTITRSVFEKLRQQRNYNPILEILQRIVQQRQSTTLKYIKLRILQKKRKMRSMQYGMEVLAKCVKSMEYSKLFKKLQNNKQLKRKFVLSSKYLVLVLDRQRIKQLCSSFFKLKQQF